MQIELSDIIGSGLHQTYLNCVYFLYASFKFKIIYTELSFLRGWLQNYFNLS